ncbi:hypothetical protein LO762_19855 [Actinocorallia sp. API 0066]|uniref:hypothetical protein n=1 Tax=Actinocorallia sp. API 0066 TaxID=2896846 RepID=UPI001E5BF92F|nr:hypothetical protein [Actinocorallia sp. API 0066]MCD0451433.1 hypothetical protein [Actinocorallia sp. API 0066]
MTVLPRRIRRPWHRFDAALRRALPPTDLDLAVRRAAHTIEGTPFTSPSPLTDRHRLLLQAVDQLCTDRMIHPTTWDALLPHYTPEQLTSLCLAVGDRATTAMLRRTLGFP